MHILCTICSDLVNQAEDIYTTKCGHIFHHHCLAQWIERSKSCPQCRHKVTEKCMFRIYPTISNEMGPEDTATLQSQLDDAQLQLRQHKAICKQKEKALRETTENLKKKMDLNKSYEKRILSHQSSITALKEQLEYMMAQNKQTNSLKDEIYTLRQNLQTLNGLQKVLDATADEVESVLSSYTDVKTVALFATALKRGLCECESKKNEFRDKLHSTKQQLALERSLVASLESNILILKEMIATSSPQKTKRKAPDTYTEPEEYIMLPSPDDHFVLDTSELDNSTSTHAILKFSGNSMNSMVQRIVDADSPYLNLRQSSVPLALSSLMRSNSVPDTGIKPSEYGIINSARDHAHKSTENNLSIFRKKQPLKPDSSKAPPDQMDWTSDGLGGHSKVDVFPTPKLKPVSKHIPRVSSRHKLRKPAAPSASQNIGKFLQNVED